MRPISGKVRAFDLPREVVSEDEVELWCRYGMFTPEPDSAQGSIFDQGNGWGVAPGQHAPHFRQRRFIRRLVHPATYSDAPSPRAAGIQLPAITGGGFLWEAAERWQAGSMDAADVLGHVAALRRRMKARSHADHLSCRGAVRPQ